MAVSQVHRREIATVRGHIIVSLAGFAIDAALLHVGLVSGLSAAASRAISLFWAMQATFALNGLYVFRRLKAEDWPGQWVRYMTSNGVGAAVNYLGFVALLASREPTLSRHYVALTISAFLAWLINYCGARYWAFGARL